MNNSERILYLLKTQGPRTAQTLAEDLGLTSMGTRKHLELLTDQGLVASDDRREGVGRPARYWRLTEVGHGRFPDRHGDLTLQLIEHVREVFGESGLDALIDRREVGAESIYRQALAGLDEPEARIRALAKARTAEGYMADVETLPEGGWLLLENHCPICAAARQCQGFCRSELKLFQTCLGPELTVERSEHLLAGARRCAYRILPRT